MVTPPRPRTHLHRLGPATLRPRLRLHGPPFRWDEDRRFLLRCELDAAYFHLYGIERDDVDYIMETFPIVKRKDIAKHGEYRTKRVILEMYDEMAAAMRSGVAISDEAGPAAGGSSGGARRIAAVQGCHYRVTWQSHSKSYFGRK